MKSALDIIEASKEAAKQEQLIRVAKQEAYERGKVDFNFFAGLCAPTIMRTLFPPFYLALFNLVITFNSDPENILRFALGLPRGFAKTTFLKILTCWLIVYEKNYYFLIVCATESKALSFIADVDAMLSSPNMEEVYGRWSQAKSVDNAKLKVAHYRGNTIFLQPAGVGTHVRGNNQNMRRPDCIICDDVQSREDAMSEAVNASQKEWFNATLLKAIESYGDHRRIIYLGNMYPGECILEMLRKNSQWVSLITGAILDDSQSLWPELRSIRSLVLEYQHDAENGLSHIWFAEVQNDPLNEQFRLLAKPIPPSDYEGLDDFPWEGSFLTVDPAGFRKNSDDNVITVHRVYDGIPVAVDIIGGVWNPEETVRNIAAMCIKWDANVVGIESVGYQQSLLFWTNKLLNEDPVLRNKVHVVEVKAGNIAKVARIRDYIHELLSGKAQMTNKVRQIFSMWAHLYKIGKTNNRDDYLDCPAYQKQMITKYGHLIFQPRDPLVALGGLPKVTEPTSGY